MLVPAAAKPQLADSGAADPLAPDASGLTLLQFKVQWQVTKCLHLTLCALVICTTFTCFFQRQHWHCLRLWRSGCWGWSSWCNNEGCSGCKSSHSNPSDHGRTRHDFQGEQARGSCSFSSTWIWSIVCLVSKHKQKYIWSQPPEQGPASEWSAMVMAARRIDLTVRFSVSNCECFCRLSKFRHVKKHLLSSRLGY